ncbi:MAG: TatD family hydrolase [Fibrobacterota bacterium]|nr:TatD family hydrolase [Fibrobacterota bacterium]QQS04057.1 MAG: TatD family hydrolase [Fibrobacterota bacterium]
MVDSHCHLQARSVRPRASEMVAQARAAGVREILIAGIVPTDAWETAELAAELGVWSSAGCHPCHADEWNPELVAAACDHPSVVAVGECGFDFFHEPFDATVQERVLREQIEIARQKDLPIILHNRKSSDDLLRVLRDAGYGRGVFHCFSASRQTLEKALALGFHISLSGTVTFSGASVRELVPDIPSDRLLIETDAPWLAPVPHRGKENRPALVVHVRDTVAKLREMDVAQLDDLLVANFRGLFPKSGKGKP